MYMDEELNAMKQRKKELFDNMADDAKYKDHVVFARLSVILNWLEGK